MKYQINTIGKVLLESQRKEVYKFIWGGILFLVVFYFGIRYGMEEIVPQLLMCSWITILYIGIFIIVPINLSKKINKTIRSVDFLDDSVRIEISRGFLICKNLKVQRAKNSFSGFGKAHKSGYVVTDLDSGREFWLIESFFNDIEDFEDKLKSFM